MSTSSGNMIDLPPYDPTARIEQLSGLEKLRAVEDRELAEDMARVWVGVIERERVEARRGGQMVFEWKEAG